MKPIFFIPVVMAVLYGNISSAELAHTTNAGDGTLADSSVPLVEYKKLDVPEQFTSLVDQKGFAVESPVVSDDESKLIYIGNSLSSRMPPNDLFIKDLTSTSEATAIKKPLLRKLNIFVKGSFTPNGGIIACELDYRFGAITRTTVNYFRNHQWDPKGYHSVISFYENGKRVKTLDAKDFGLPDGTFLEHPRVSSDNRYIAFYIQGDASNQGIYVYNRETRKTSYLGNYADKHPTWSPDGKKIFFHEQGKLNGTGEEIARIGYYNIAYTDDEATMESRVILGETADQPMGATYIYAKHPAYHAGLNLVLFHARDTKDNGKEIGAFSLDHPHHKPVLMKISFNGKKVKGSEHADVSIREDSNLYFVGKVNGETSKRVLKLDYEALKLLRQKFE
jgi:hypothetical protein